MAYASIPEKVNIESREKEVQLNFVKINSTR